MCLRDLCINKIASVIDNPVLDIDGLLLRMVQPTNIALYKSAKVVCMQSHLYFVFLICSPGWLIGPKILSGGAGQCPVRHRIIQMETGILQGSVFLFWQLV